MDLTTKRSVAHSTKRLLACCALLLGLTGCVSESNSKPDDVLPEIELPAELERSQGFGALPAIPLADSTFEGDHFSGSGACGVCHNGMIDDEGEDVSIETAWQTSVMAQSARDPYWRAVAAATLHRFPELSHEVNQVCTRCHAPMANDAALKDGVELEMFGDTPFLSDNKYFDHAMDGVSCALCHQIDDNGTLGTEAGNSGNFSIVEFDADEKENRPAYGQYVDPIGAYMIVNSNFTPVYGAHMSDSAVCATCHDLKTHKLDADGQPIDGPLEAGFQEQQTYSEWENSDYRDSGPLAASCQACHMPKIDTTVTLASSGTDIRRSGFSEHTFLGANTVMLDMFENYKDFLGIQADGFPQAIERNREFLKTAADLEIIGTRSEQDAFVVTLQITNNTGHKLPSGYPSRRVFVQLAVTDDNGSVIFESGKVNDDGSIVGADGDRDFNKVEPHYNSVINENQVLIYEAIMANASGETTHSLVEGIRYLKDNRLTPKGFKKASADNDIAVVGRAANDGNFDDGTDLFEYRIPVSQGGTYQVIANLIYQPLAYGHLEHLFRDTIVPEVDQFKTIYDNTELKTETISTATSQHVQ